MPVAIPLMVYLWTDLDGHEEAESFDDFSYGDAELTIVKRDAILSELAGNVARLEDMGTPSRAALVQKLHDLVASLPEDALIAFDG